MYPITRLSKFYDKIINVDRKEIWRQDTSLSDTTLMSLIYDVFSKRWRRRAKQECSKSTDPKCKLMLAKSPKSAEKKIRADRSSILSSYESCRTHLFALQTIF